MEANSYNKKNFNKVVNNFIQQYKWFSYSLFVTGILSIFTIIFVIVYFYVKLKCLAFSIYLFNGLRIASGIVSINGSN